MLPSNASGSVSSLAKRSLSRPATSARTAPPSRWRFASANSIRTAVGFYAWSATSRSASRAEDELRATEQRFRTFVDYAIDGFFLLDINSMVLDVNRQGCENLGYNREELIGQHRSLFDPDLDQVSTARLAQHRFTGETVTFESHHRRKDGSSLPVEVRVARSSKGDGGFWPWSETSRSASGRRMNCARARSASVPSSSSRSTCIGKPTPSIALSARSLPKSLADAPTPGSEIGKTRWEAPYLEPDAEGWRRHRETLDAHLPFRDFELARPTPDGGKRYVSVSGLPVFDKTGRFTGYRGVGRHITERKKAEEALRRSEAYLAEAERLSLSGAFAFNAQGSLYWSEGDLPAMGIRSATGHPERRSLVATRPSGGSRQGIRRPPGGIAPETRLRDRVQTCSSRWDVQTCPVDRSSVLHREGRPPRGRRDDTRHLTERVRAQAEHERLQQLETDLAHLNRLSIMGELTASLAHEILHPIAAARNNARAGMRFLEMSPPDLDEVKEALACVVRDADRGKDIVGRIRDHIKKAPPREEPVDLTEAINEVIVMVRNATRQKQGLGPHLPHGANGLRSGGPCSAATGRPEI